MTKRWVRSTALATVLAFSVATAGCGYILYPERRGATSGRIDPGALVMDLLWLIPGIIPGVVALVVDFSTGAIYVRGRRRALRVPESGVVALSVPAMAKPMRLDLRLVTASHRVLARKTVLASATTATPVSLKLADARTHSQRGGNRASAAEAVYLEVLTENGAVARLDAPIEPHEL